MTATMAIFSTWPNFGWFSNFHRTKNYQKTIGLQLILSDLEIRKVSAAWFKWLSTFPENILGAKKFLEDVEIFLNLSISSDIEGKVFGFWPKKPYFDWKIFVKVIKAALNDSRGTF